MLLPKAGLSLVRSGGSRISPSFILFIFIYKGVFSFGSKWFFLLFLQRKNKTLCFLLFKETEAGCLDRKLVHSTLSKPHCIMNKLSFGHDEERSLLWAWWEPSIPAVLSVSFGSNILIPWSSRPECERQQHLVSVWADANSRSGPSVRLWWSSRSSQGRLVSKIGNYEKLRRGCLLCAVKMQFPKSWDRKAQRASHSMIWCQSEPMLILKEPWYLLFPSSSSSSTRVSLPWTENDPFCCYSKGNGKPWLLCRFKEHGLGCVFRLLVYSSFIKHHSMTIMASFGHDESHQFRPFCWVLESNFPIWRPRMRATAVFGANAGRC